MHTVLPSPSAQSGAPHLRKEVEVCGSGSRHHQLSHLHDLQLIQSHVAPSHGKDHQQESFHPFSSRQSLSCFLSHVAKGSTPKPRGPRKDTRSQKETPNGCLGLNPSANLPLQPHFQLLPQLATAASIPGRCGPVVWSQLSPSSFGPHYKSLFGASLLYTLLHKYHERKIFLS